MAKFNNPKEFRNKATQADYENLLNIYLSAKSADWEKYSEEYGFSRSSALALLREKGMLEDTKTTDVERLQFREMKLDTKQRTVYVADDTWEKLQALYDVYPSRSKNYVLDAIIQDACDRYMENE